MAVNSIFTKVILENKKYRILRFDPPLGKAHNLDIFLGCHHRFQLQITDCIVRLQQRCWFFGWFWKTLGTTNKYSVGKEWIETYFEGERRMKVGTRIVIVSKGHPWSGHSGKYVGVAKTMIGQKHEVELDKGIRCMVDSLSELQYEDF